MFNNIYAPSILYMCYYSFSTIPRGAYIRMKLWKVILFIVRASFLCICTKNVITIDIKIVKRNKFLMLLYVLSQKWLFSACCCIRAQTTFSQAEQRKWKLSHHSIELYIMLMLFCCDRSKVSINYIVSFKIIYNRCAPSLNIINFLM